jgi:hypothetical protein
MRATRAHLFQLSLTSRSEPCGRAKKYQKNGIFLGSATINKGTFLPPGRGRGADVLAAGRADHARRVPGRQPQLLGLGGRPAGVLCHRRHRALLVRRALSPCDPLMGTTPHAPCSSGRPGYPIALSCARLPMRPARAAIRGTWACLGAPAQYNAPCWTTPSHVCFGRRDAGATQFAPRHRQAAHAHLLMKHGLNWSHASKRYQSPALLNVPCLAARRFDIFVGLPMDLNDMYWLGEVLPQARPCTVTGVQLPCSPHSMRRAWQLTCGCTSRSAGGSPGCWRGAMQAAAIEGQEVGLTSSSGARAGGRRQGHVGAYAGAERRAGGRHGGVRPAGRGGAARV